MICLEKRHRLRASLRKIRAAQMRNWIVSLQPSELVPRMQQGKNCQSMLENARPMFVVANGDDIARPAMVRRDTRDLSLLKTSIGSNASPLPALSSKMKVRMVPRFTGRDQLEFPGVIDRGSSKEEAKIRQSRKKMQNIRRIRETLVDRQDPAYDSSHLMGD